MNKNVSMLWVNGRIGRLETLCMNSFLAQGHALTVWSYDRIDNLPSGARLGDAAAILPEARIFRNQNGSFAGFSDLFRFAVLSRLGGLYADADVICLAPPSELGDKPFFVSERTLPNLVQVNGNVIYLPQPKRGDLIDLALALTDRFPVDNMRWGDCGPTLLTALVKIYPALAPEVKPPQYANPFAPMQCPADLLAPGGVVDPETRFLHCYNDMWRRAGVDKDAPYPPGSILDSFARLYL